MYVIVKLTSVYDLFDSFVKIIKYFERVHIARTNSVMTAGIFVT